jgi:hypothetical protein
MLILGKDNYFRTIMQYTIATNYSNIIKVITSWACSRHDVMNDYDVLVGRSKKRPHKKPRRRQKDNIEMDLKHVRCEGVTMWIGFTWRALVNTVMNLWFLLKVGNSLITCASARVVSKNSASWS